MRLAVWLPLGVAELLVQVDTSTVSLKVRVPRTLAIYKILPVGRPIQDNLA